MDWMAHRSIQTNLKKVRRRILLRKAKEALLSSDDSSVTNESVKRGPNLDILNESKDSTDTKERRPKKAFPRKSNYLKEFGHHSAEVSHRLPRGSSFDTQRICLDYSCRWMLKKVYIVSKKIGCSSKESWNKKSSPLLNFSPFYFETADVCSTTWTTERKANGSVAARSASTFRSICKPDFR